VKSRFILENLSTINQRMSSFNENFYKTRQFDMFKILESTVDINLAIVMVTMSILNGLVCNSLTIKWFVEDISGHLFHFLDEDHAHESCPSHHAAINLTFDSLENSVSNSSQRMSTTTTSRVSDVNDHVLFKSNLVMTVTELLVCLFYFSCLIVSNYYKNKASQDSINTSNANSRYSIKNFFKFLTHTGSNNYESSGTNLENRLGFMRKIISSLSFYILIFIILALTLSVSSFKFTVADCETFYKKPSSNYVSLYLNTNLN
jgi:hypothetical protein